MSCGVSCLCIKIHDSSLVFFDLQYPWDVIKKAWNLGLINTHIPSSCGKLLINYSGTWGSSTHISLVVVISCSLITVEPGTHQHTYP